MIRAGLTSVLFLGSLVFATLSVPAQVRVEVVPGMYSSTEASTHFHLPLTNGTSRTQILIHPNLLGGLGSSAVISALGFRPDGGATYASKSLSLEVILSRAANLPDAADSDYGKNRGTSPVTVLPRTNVSLPLAGKPTNPPSTVRAWLRFTKTFSWSGGPLAIEVANFTSTTAAWQVDATRAGNYGFGRAVYEGNPCPIGKNTIVSSTVPWPGAPVEWKTRLLQASLANGSAVLAVGVGQTNWGGMTLPFNLDPVLGTSGCTLYTDFVFGFTGVITGSQAEIDMGVLPRQSALAGVTFTAQWIVIDGGLPGGFGFSNLARIRTGMAPPFVTLYNYLTNTNPGATTAEFVADLMPVIFLEVK